MSKENNQIVAATQCWIEKVVIGLNFCPFAKRVFVQERIQYWVDSGDDIETSLLELVQALERMDADETIETALLVYPNAFEDFENYLDFLELANALLIDQDYEGIYQLASFHPDYCFAQSKQNDPANYTNRSPYPMLHLLREESLENALEHYENPEEIPERNIALAHKLGESHFVNLLKSCLSS